MKIKNLLILAIALLAVFGILLSVAELPPYGEGENPVHNEVSERYINSALEETGSVNMVASIVLDYRHMILCMRQLFTATLAVVITLNHLKRRR